MAVPPSFSTGLPTQLMTEEDIRQYFVRNGGVVKNTDIVNYFRPYLSNPAFKGNRDPSRNSHYFYYTFLAFTVLK